MKTLSLFILLSFYSVLSAQQETEIKIKKIIDLEKSFIFKFKDLKTREVNYFLSYKKDSCSKGIEIEKNKKYRIILSEINILHQKDGNEYLIGVDNFNIPKNYKLFYSEHVKGAYICK